MRARFRTSFFGIPICSSDFEQLPLSPCVRAFRKNCCKKSRNKRRELSRKTLKSEEVLFRVVFVPLCVRLEGKGHANLNTAGGYRGQTQPILIEKLKEQKNGKPRVNAYIQWNGNFWVNLKDYYYLWKHFRKRRNRDPLRDSRMQNGRTVVACKE